MSVLKSLLVVVSCLTAVACGSTVNSGNPTPGGAPGNTCNATTAPVGCYTTPAGVSTIVNCPADVSPAAWTSGQNCASGTHCVLNSKTEASCVANAVVVVNDTVSGGKDTDNGSACVASACAKETAACVGSPKCTAALTCLSNCKEDKACQDGCGAPLQTDPAATKIVQDYFQCALNAAFSCAGAGDASSGDGFSAKE